MGSLEAANDNNGTLPTPNVSGIPTMSTSSDFDDLQRYITVLKRQDSYWRDAPELEKLM